MADEDETRKEQEQAQEEEEEEDAEVEDLKRQLEEIEREEQLKQQQEEGAAAAKAADNSTSNTTTTAFPPGGLPPAVIDENSIHVGMLAERTTPEDLQRHFKTCGEVKRATIICDKWTGRPKGFAYIEFTEPTAVEIALGLHESTLNGQPITVTAKRQNVPSFILRGRGGGGYRGAPRGGRGAYRGYRGGGYPPRGGAYRGGGGGYYRGGGGYAPY